jgi:hypothetical protein
MKVRKAGAVSPPSGYETFERKVHFEQDKIAAVYGRYFSDPESSFWTWDYLIAGQGVKTFPFRADGVARNGRDATLTVRLTGATDTNANPDHHAIVRVNGRMVGEAMWDGLDHETLTLSIDPGILSDGSNTLEIEARRDTGAPYSVIYLDWFDLEYDSLYRATENVLEFSADGNQTVLVSGFSRSDIMIFDITDPKTPIYIEASSIVAGNSYGVAIAPEAPWNHYIALTPDAVVHANRIKPDTPSNLASSSNLGEYLVITSLELSDTAQRLTHYRVDLASQVIDIEDIWDEFNYGIASPHALRNFFEHALESWTVPPRYVVLAGSGTFDYKDYMGNGDNLIPPMHVNTPHGLFPSDNWLANTDLSTAVPEVAIGRIPATTRAELDAAIDKIIARESRLGEVWTNKVVMLADNGDQAGNFPRDSDRIAATLPAGVPMEKIYLSNVAVGTARTMALNAINQGAGFVSYVGHGGFDRFAAEGMLRDVDLQHLVNVDRPTVITGMTCNVGYFSLPGYASLGERLLYQPTGGAAAVWVATGMSQNEHAVALAMAFYGAVPADGNLRIGDVILSALKTYEGEQRPSYMVDIYVLLGDPAMKLH